jgi:hypothetical protein
MRLYAFTLLLSSLGKINFSMNINISFFSYNKAPEFYQAGNKKTVKQFFAIKCIYLCFLISRSTGSKWNLSRLWHYLLISLPLFCQAHPHGGTQKKLYRYEYPQNVSQTT